MDKKYALANYCEYLAIKLDNQFKTWKLLVLCRVIKIKKL